jgi:hypothetical protein
LLNDSLPHSYEFYEFAAGNGLLQQTRIPKFQTAAGQKLFGFENFLKPVFQKSAAAEKLPAGNSCSSCTQSYLLLNE